MFHAVKHVGGRVLWANLHLRFWLSLRPFTSGFMGENHFAAIPTFRYALNLLLCARAHTGLVFALVGQHGRYSDFTRTLKSGRKEQVSTLIHVIAVPLALILPMVSLALVTIVAVLWVVPDRRFARTATLPEPPLCQRGRSRLRRRFSPSAGHRGSGAAGSGLAAGPSGLRPGCVGSGR